MEWISVDDKLPEDGSLVLSFNGMAGVNMAVYNAVGKKGIDDFRLLHWGKDVGTWYPYIKYWAIPKPPK